MPKLNSPDSTGFGCSPRRLTGLGSSSPAGIARHCSPSPRRRRHVARCRHEDEEAECLRRLHHGGRVADCQQVHVTREAGGAGWVQRRTAGRRGHQSAPGSLPRRHPASGRDGHAAVPQVHDWVELDCGLRVERQPGRVQGASCLLAAAQHQDGREYPATLITTADHDDRVVPAHSFKYAATLQKAASKENSVLIRIETKSGHGASNVTKQIEATADIYAFIMHNMGIRPRMGTD